MDGHNLDFEVRQATEEESRDFAQMFVEVNWGIWSKGQMVALFQAEAQQDGWLNVHARVRRHSLHPNYTLFYAKKFADRLLEYGATGLMAEIPIKHRAAIRIAKAAGFIEQLQNEEWVILTRLPNGKSEADETAIRAEAGISGMDTE